MAFVFVLPVLARAGLASCAVYSAHLSPTGCKNLAEGRRAKRRTLGARSRYLRTLKACYSSGP
ncbi:MAG: hypothetical protein JNK16_06190 [Phycisphaerales bacterium]|nr:hypothetical protein [Phycisphaerales bacterium]